jgi:anti-anti-sigma factor
LYGIEVCEYRTGTIVWLRGELDLFTLDALRETLGRVLGLGRPALVDLSGITFLDLASARELAASFQLHPGYLTLRNPSRWVLASIEAFGMGQWIRFHPTSDREEPPVVSEAPS